MASDQQLLNDKMFVQKIDVEALQNNLELENKWERIKSEFTLLHTCLENFPKQLSASILMPIGSKVYVRAQLVNTNEVFIRYNEMFTKQTAYEAKTVCERHIERCDGMLKNLTREKQLLNTNVCARQEIITDSDQLKEIIEPYDEKEHEAWKKIHRQKVKKYRQQLKDERVKNKDCVEDLNEVEDKKDDEIIEFIPFYSYAAPNLNPRQQFLEYDSNDDDSTDSDDNDDYEDEEEDEDNKIEIVFTNDVPETTGNLKKSLKKRVSFNNNIEIKEFEPRPDEHFIPRKEETIQENEKPEILVTEIEDIVERVSETYLENTTRYEENDVRPMSRFKANRNKSNNNK